MCRRRSISTYLTTVSLVLMLLIAGCIGFPLSGDAEQGAPVTFVANNTENTTYTFEVFVIDLPANISITRSDGKRGEAGIGQGVGPLYPSGERYYTEVQPDPQASSHHGNFTVETGEEMKSNITSLLQYGAVVVVVYDGDGRITGFVEANCDDLALTYLGVTTDAERFHVQFSCD